MHLNMIVSMCDLTTLEGEDTEGKVSQMVAKAIILLIRMILILKMLLQFVFILHWSVLQKKRVGNSSVKVAAVSSYFPSGQVPMESKLLDTKYAIDSGADEIDIVINRKAFLEGDYRKVYDEILALKEVVWRCSSKNNS